MSGPKPPLVRAIFVLSYKLRGGLLRKSLNLLTLNYDFFTIYSSTLPP